MKKLVIGAMFAVSIVGASAGVASAQNGCAYPDICTDVVVPDPDAPKLEVAVKGVTLDGTDAPAAAPAAPVVAAQAQLPITGVETGVLAGAGLALIAGGGLLVLRSRKVADATA